MNKIGIITDTSSDLTPELCKLYNIERIPFYVSINGINYLLGKDILPEEVFAHVKLNKKTLPTLQNSSAIYSEYFTNYLQKYDELVYLSLSSKVSGAYKNALIASMEVSPNKIRVIDSLNISNGVGLLVLKACELRALNKSTQEIIEEINTYIPLVRTQFVINTQTYIKNKEFSFIKRLFLSLFKTKIIIKVINGDIIEARKHIGKNNISSQMLLKYIKKDKDKIDLTNIFLSHNQAISDIEYMEKELINIINPQKIYKSNADAILSTYFGPRTFGILYMLKK